MAISISQGDCAASDRVGHLPFPFWGPVSAHTHPSSSNGSVCPCSPALRTACRVHSLPEASGLPQFTSHWPGHTVVCPLPLVVQRHERPVSEPHRTPGGPPVREVGRPQLANPLLERVQEQPVMTADVTPVRRRRACPAVALPRGVSCYCLCLVNILYLVLKFCLR